MAEPSGRVYPFSDQANSVVDVLRFALDRPNIRLAAGAEVIHDPAAAPEDAVVIGGESVYRQLLPRCGTVYVTKIFASPQADAFFPDLSRDSGWTEAERSEMYTSGGVRFQYVTYRRR